MSYSDQLSQFKSQLKSLDLTFRGTKEIKEASLRSLEQEVKVVLSKLYTTTSPDELLQLADIFGVLAEIRIKLGNITHDPKCYTDAAIRLMYVTKIIEANKLLENATSLEQASALHNTSTTYLAKIHNIIAGTEENTPAHFDNDFSHKNDLLALREEVKSSLKIVDSSSTQELFSIISKTMGQYLAALFYDAETIMGPPPCKYAVIGLGSMALRQITPYSDLEFAILTENDIYKTESTNPKIIRYFKNLTHYVHFKVILLGETIIPTSDYNLDLSHLVKPAVQFDLGGKTPLGRIDNDKPYSLIQTIDEMLKYVQNSENQFEHIDKHLPYILETSCFICGTKDLVTTYQTQVTNFLLSGSTTQKHCEYRAIKRLAFDTVEIDPITLVQAKKNESNRNAFEQFGAALDRPSGKIFDVKQEIYRLADRFIYNLGLICGIVDLEGGSWSIIEQLVKLEKITPTAGKNLMEALSFANLLRLRIYDYYECQAEEMDVGGRDNGQPLTGRFQLTEVELHEGSGLFSFYYTVLPLISKLAHFCIEHVSFTIQEKAQFFYGEEVYQETNTNKGQIYLRLMRYDEALKCFDNVVPSNIPDLRRSGEILYKLGRYTEAVIKYEKALELYYSSALGPSLSNNNGTLIHNIGLAYNGLGWADKALLKYKEALVIFMKVYGPNHSSVAGALNNIGITHIDLGQYENAKGYLEKSLVMLRALYHEKHHYKHHYIATTLSNIGVIYNELGFLEPALSKFEEALLIQQKIYGFSSPDVAHVLSHIGVICGRLDKHEEALLKLEQALVIYRRVYGDSHTDVAISLNNIGMELKALGRNEEALLKLEQSLVILKEIYGDKNHPDIAKILNNTGIIYNNSEMSLVALLKHYEALEMYRAVLTDSNHPNIAKVLFQIGMIYQYLHLPEKALEIYAEALTINIEAYGNKHLYVAKVLFLMGFVNTTLDRQEKALKFLEESLATRRQFSPEDDKDVQQTLQLIDVVKNQLLTAILLGAEEQHQRDPQKSFSISEFLEQRGLDKTSSLLHEEKHKNLLAQIHQKACWALENRLQELTPKDRQYLNILQKKVAAMTELLNEQKDDKGIGFNQPEPKLSSNDDGTSIERPLMAEFSEIDLNESWS